MMNWKGCIVARITLVFPKKEYEKHVMAYKKEFEISGDSMDGTAGLRDVTSYEEWFSAIIDNSKEETVRTGLVPASTYLAVRCCDQRIVGMVDIRHRLNEYLSQFGGHIGYSVRKSERNKGYAKEILNLALEKCRDRNMKQILITCDKENIASAKTTINNGGVLGKE